MPLLIWFLIWSAMVRRPSLSISDIACATSVTPPTSTGSYAALFPPPPTASLGLQLRCLAGKFPVLGVQPLDGLDGLAGIHLERVDHAVKRRALLLRPLDGARAGHRFNPADAGRDAAFGENHEKPDVAGGVDVRAAAQLHAEARHADDPDLVAVLFPEQRHGAGRDRLLRRHVHVCDHWRVAVHLLVDDAFDAVEVIARDRLEVHEIESQAVGRDERAGLFHVRAKHLPQRGVEQVGRRMVAPAWRRGCPRPLRP